MNRKKVIVFEHIDENGLNLLFADNLLDVIYYDSKPVSPEVVEKDLKEARAVLVRTTEVTREMIQTAQQLEIISKHGVGYDNVDISAASERKIPVTITPGSNSNSVAEHILAMIMTIAKNLIAADTDLKQNRFKRKEHYAGEELGGKTLGIIGLGRIGSRLARKAHLGFGMNVLAFDPYIGNEYASRFEARRVAKLDELLQSSDYVSLNVPLTELTLNMIGERELDLMKTGAVLINTSRGGVVDEAALYRALTENQIRAAGLDVFAVEPPVPGDNPLLSLSSVLVTPHTAGGSIEAGVQTAVMAATEIINVLHGRPPENPVNPQSCQADA